jgi:hypothetical protein
MSDEIAKATHAVAETTGKAIDLAQKIGSFFNRIVGPPADELGGVLQDWTRYFRYKNLAKIADKVDAIHAQRKAAGKTTPILPKYAIPILEKAALEDDDSLQNMWAGLIANATDPNKRLNLQRVFADILGSLEPLDVRVLEFLNNQGWAQFKEVSGGITLDVLAEQLKTPQSDLKISLPNLHRLGLLVDEWSIEKINASRHAPIGGIGSASFGANMLRAGTSFRLSPLGNDLLKACKAA